MFYDELGNNKSRTDFAQSGEVYNIDWVDYDSLDYEAYMQDN